MAMPAVWDEMVTALANSTQPMTCSADNAKSLGMVLAAIESAERGEKVPCGYRSRSQRHLRIGASA